MSNEMQTETPAPEAATEAGAVDSPVGPRIGLSRRDATSFGLRYAMAAIRMPAIAAEIAYPGFFARESVEQMLSQNAGQGLVAMGMTFVILAAGFDLSVAAIFAMGAVCYVGLGDKDGARLAPSCW